MREIRTLGLMRRGLETGLWWRYWGTPVRKRGATDRRNLRSRASPRPYVCPAKAGVFSGKQSHQGKSQDPCSLDSQEEGN